MKKSNRKRQIVMATLVLALGAAVFMNWYFSSDGQGLIDISGIQASLNGETTEAGKNLGDSQYVSATTKASTTAATEESEYFVQAKLERTKARDTALEQLQKIIDDEKASEAATKEAAQAVERLSQNIKKENDIENLIKAKNISNCLAIINDDNVEVIVKVSDLNETLILQIKEIVIKQTQVSIENVTVVQVK